MAQATYSAAALAAAVGVPRTTINDWLSRYEDYIDSISVGKRKVYSEESLKILQEIASLRDSGKSSAEIEAVLAGKHGVKPEVASEEPSRTAVSAEPAPAAAPEAENKTANNVTNDESSQLPAIREFEKNAMELTAFIAELRNQQLRSRSRSRWTILLLMLLIAVLLAGLSGLYHALKAQEAQRQLEAVKMQQEFRKLNEDFTAELKQQNELRIREREEAARNAGKLQSELLKLHKERASEAAKLEEKLAEQRKPYL